MSLGCKRTQSNTAMAGWASHRATGKRLQVAACNPQPAMID